MAGLATNVATVVTLLAQQPQTFRSDVHTVAVYATVQDRDGRLVPDLTKDDFKIIDNGRPAPITTFSHEILPITVALMLDMSDSMRMDYGNRLTERHLRTRVARYVSDDWRRWVVYQAVHQDLSGLQRRGVQERRPSLATISGWI